jgi:hypothetical protein
MTTTMLARMYVRRRLALVLLVLCGAFLPLPSAAHTRGEQQVAAGSEARASAHLESVRDQPLLLRPFLRAFPKGGDIHNHLAGAVYAEDFIAIAARHGLCVDASTYVLKKPPCSTAAPAVADALTRPAIYNGMINAWSMREFGPSSAESGHDHFFNSFGKFSLASSLDVGDQLAQVASHAAAQNVSYLELMHTVDGSAAADLGSKVGWEDNLEDLQSRLMSAGMNQVVQDSSKSLDDAEANYRSELLCDTAAADPGCGVTIRFLYQAIRTQPPERVFAQFFLGFLLAQSDSRVVGINLVAPEDDYTALRDYTLQMSMLDALHARYPEVNIALHAGELRAGLVKPENLRFHIRQAIELGHASRIGHGTDVMEEDDPFGLLEQMADSHVLVEISLLSSLQILGVSGTDHPLSVYLSSGVPVALATDDEGVSRSDLTAEFVLVVQSFGLRYDDIKRIARASIEHSFLPGDDLWQGPDDYHLGSACASDHPDGSTLTNACSRLLDTSVRAHQEWQLEQSLYDFERGF